MRQWNKKILAVHMEWDYCDRARGPSPEKDWFYSNLKRLAPASDVFYYDEFVKDVPLLRRRLTEKAEAFAPDLIFFVPFTDQFDAPFLDGLRKRWPTCAWFGDDTWRFNSFSSKLAPHFTHVLTTDPFSLDRYGRIGIRPILTQWAADPRPGLDPSPPEKFDYEVSFVGGKDPVRAWFVGRLASMGVRVECFGAGWPNGRVSFEEMDRIFRTSRINLNLSNSVPRDIRFVLGGPMNFLKFLRSRKTAEQIKARNFEIPLAGGFQLSNSVPGLELYFDIGREISVFTGIEECADKVRAYLSDEPARAAVAAAGAARAAREHTYLARLEKILGKIWG